MDHPKYGDTPSLTALWDTGATDCYIDLRAAARFNKLRLNFPSPIELRLFDGNASSAGLITQYIDFNIRVHPSHASVPIRVNITKLCGADLVLGSMWMTKNGANIDLPSSTLTIDLPTKKSPISSTLRVSESWQHQVLICSRFVLL
jgi:hypothetical protein